MMIHHKARPIVSKLTIPTPLQKYFLPQDWEIDLGSNTNPYMGEFSEYPDVRQDHLKNLYLQTVLSLNSSPSFTERDRGSLTSDHLMFTAGSMEGLDLLLRTFTEPIKDTICIASPTFSAYEHWALIHGLAIKSVPFFGDNLEKIDIEKIVRIDPKLVFICNPNNPTGTLLQPKMIADLCDGVEGLVVVDEAYIEFSDQPSFLFNLKKYKNLIILRTLSKAWGLAGVRCGAIFADPLIINALRHVQFPYSLSSFSQIKVEEQLLYPESTFASWEKIKNSRENLIQELLKLDVVERVFKSHTNFIMLTLKNYEQAINTIREHRIYVLDCSQSLPNAIRVSLGTEGQNSLFLKALKEVNMIRFP